MRPRTFALAIFASMLTVSMFACSESATESNADRVAPTIKLTSASSSVDSILSFSADVNDNLGIKRIHIQATDGVTSVFDTTFNTAVTSIDLPLSISVPRSVASGTPVTILGTAIDGAGNQSPVDTLRLTAGNLAPATVRLTAPASGSVAVIGKSIILSISGTSKVKVAVLGFTTSGALSGTDSTILTSPLKDSLAILDTLAIPSTAKPGSLVITPFIRDSLGNRLTGAPVTINVQTASNVLAPPIVNFGSEKRVEVNDTLFVSAIDTSGAGIDTLGYEIRTAASGPVVLSGQYQSNSQFTSQQHTFSLAIPASLTSSLPLTIYVKAYGVTANHAKGYAKLSNGTERVDTLVVVAGVTRQLPNGGEIADAVYHPRWDRLYLTNITRDQLEVFSLADSSFHSSIPVGSRPWGLALWPRDRAGTPGDTIMIANSGGTSIGYVNVANASTSLEGREVYRYPLPLLAVYTVTTTTSSTSGSPIAVKTLHKFSDRPQYVAGLCKTASLLSSACTEVVALYSTTPTAGQTEPLKNRGTLRYENLTTKSSHFFFEHALGQAAARADTLEIQRQAAQGIGADSTLVPYRQQFITPHIPAFAADTFRKSDTTVYSMVVDVDKLPFYDTTFVRGSGNFHRGLMGEGGPASNARAVGYDVMRGMQTTITLPNGTTGLLGPAVVDNGVSNTLSVHDHVANAAAAVHGVGINFDGALGAIRADSIYIVDPQLRLQGLIQTSTSGNAGFDFHPQNAGLGFGGTTPCYIFAASTEPVIEVYENSHYTRVTTIPIKSPIIGPIKSALAANGKLMLVGATSKGVIIVTLPASSYNGCPL